MITEHIGNILNSGANIICQQVNCKGVMGAGLAKEIRDKYPVVYTKYKERCALGNCLGSLILVNVEKDVCICCLFGQDGYGRDRQYTDYTALRSSLSAVANNTVGIRIAVPYGLGCGLAGGNWSVVRSMLEEVFNNSTCEIWRRP